jgi:osmoprotectant transport system ATP-binding protein
VKEAAVELSDVWKQFGSRRVLESIDLRFPDGETTAVVGESGSGKSTLLQLINAVYSADRGTVRVLGEPVPTVDVHLWRRSIGYAVQGAGLFPHLDVRANVTLLARLARREPEFIERRYRVLTELMGLGIELDRRFPHALSGGERQRVGLCRALMLQPKLLLLDEPFSAVDPIVRRGLYDLFDRLRAHESVTAVLVTHDPREARRLARYVVVLRDGRVQQSGPIDEVLHDPANEYVRSLWAEEVA